MCFTSLETAKLSSSGPSSLEKNVHVEWILRIGQLVILSACVPWSWPPQAQWLHPFKSVLLRACRQTQSCSDSGKGAWGPSLFSIPQLKVIVVSFSTWQRSLSVFTGRWRVWHMELTFVCVCVCVCEWERERERYKQWYVKLDEVIVWWHHIASLKLVKERVTYRNWKTLQFKAFLKKFFFNLLLILSESVVGHSFHWP